jgi:hypothetical protein
MKLLASLGALTILAGCSTFPSGNSPRALQIGALQPACLVFCMATSTATDSEKGGTISSNTTASPSTTLTGTVGVKE